MKQNRRVCKVTSSEEIAEFLEEYPETIQTYISEIQTETQML